jgi:hypothetical protein
MTRRVPKDKVEYGDFQTPLELAERVCQQLVKLQVTPDVIVEPTCGVGNFIEAASHSFPSAKKIIGVEVNPQYIQTIKTKKLLIQDARIELQQADFFQLDWLSLIDRLDGNILILGNFPWVTNSQQGSMGGENLPLKNNFHNYNGLDAITGKSNFDISEWMLIQVIQWLQNREANLAMLCKVSVARKLLNYLRAQNLNLAYCATYEIDAKKYFDVTVAACLLFCKFDLSSKNYFCDVFSDFENQASHQIGYRDNFLTRDVAAFDKLRQFHTTNPAIKWRSGIKHDCADVMEFRKINNTFVNRMGEAIALEETYLFPLLKGSDIIQSRVNATDRYVLVTQKFVGEPTAGIKTIAPKTWEYLESHASYLENRKSKIYQNHPKFSIFGVGDYTFRAWKIAICGLYKKLEFKLVGRMLNKPAVFDDTVYFLSFEDEQTALKTFQVLTSPSVIEFYSSLIFWDEKRPIKATILNSLDLAALVESINSP